jgi:RAQPRD family integrative conjugative element protein
MIHVVHLCVVSVWCVLTLTGDTLHAQGIEEQSRLYLNTALFHLRQAQRYADRSSQTVPLAGFDYPLLQQDLDAVADGVQLFLHPRPGEPIRVVPVEIDGRYLAEELLQAGKKLEAPHPRTEEEDTLLNLFPEDIP